MFIKKLDFKNLSIYFCLYSIIVLTFLPFEQVSSQDISDQLRVTVEEANIRSGAGTAHTVILTVSRGMILPINRVEGDWFQVRLSPEFGTHHEIGYIHSSIVELVESSVISSPQQVSNLPRSSQERPYSSQGLSGNREYKDADKALLYGILVPGGGHFYAGETITGGIVLGAALLAPIIGTMIATNDARSLNYNVTPIYLGVAVSLGAWVYSVIDGPKAAERMNRLNGLAWDSKFQISPDMVAFNNNKIGYGVKMRIQF